MTTHNKRKSLHTTLFLTTLTVTLLPASSSFLSIYHCRRLGSKLDQYPSDMSRYEDIFRATQRKHYEMKQFKKQHPPSDTSDPLNIAMGYNEESLGKMRMAKALRRVHDDPNNPAGINYKGEQSEKGKPPQYDPASACRRGAFVVDIKRKSWSRPGKILCNFDDAGLVAEAMVSLGADAVIVNLDYDIYGGDITELKAVVKAVRKVSPTAAVIMKDIIVDKIQLALAKDAGCDGVILMASVLGENLESFVNQCSIMGLEMLVEVHTPNEVDAALDMLVTNFLVSNYDRLNGEYHPYQAEKLAGMFPGTGPLITIATGGIESPDQARALLRAGYDGVVVGKAVMGNADAPKFISMIRDRELLPAQVGDLGVDDLDIETADLEELIRQQNEDSEEPLYSDENSFQ